MSCPRTSKHPIVILKHGALGDLFLALEAMQSVRDRHRNAHLILVTEPAYVSFAEKTGLFQEVWPDARSWRTFFSIPWKLTKLKYPRIYDFQNSKRTKYYFEFMGSFRVRLSWFFEWSGVLPRCTYPYNPPDRRQKPVPQRLKEQLLVAGVPSTRKANFDFLVEDVPEGILQESTILLMPGCSKGRLQKRWPLKSFLDLAGRLQEAGLTPVFVGGPDELELRDQISKTSFKNLIGKTSLGQVAGLIQHAKVWIGNDTGLTHLACLMGCPTVVLWSNAAANASIFAPQADNAQILSVDDLTDLGVDTVEQAVKDAIK
ncbi:MAG: glycosyltransferase family 9 protein [bacterium]|nr:glycosyltransferase family 9 protein [bacterium]